MTEWEPSCCLYFGDNVLQDVLAPKKFTTSIDSVAVSEELLAEGMANADAHAPHPHAEDIVSERWGSYFYSTDPRVVKRRGAVVRGKASSFKGNSPSDVMAGHRTPTAQSREEEVKK